MYGGRVEGRNYVVIIRSHQIIGIEEMFTAVLAVRVGVQHEESRLSWGSVAEWRSRCSVGESLPSGGVATESENSADDGESRTSIKEDLVISAGDKQISG